MVEFSNFFYSGISLHYHISTQGCSLKDSMRRVWAQTHHRTQTEHIYDLLLRMLGNLSVPGTVPVSIWFGNTQASLTCFDWVQKRLAGLVGDEVFPPFS